MAGERIHGLLSLPDQAGGNAVQNVSLELVVGDTTLQSSDYALVVLDNISGQLKLGTYDSIRTGPISVIPPEVLRLADTGIPPLFDQVHLICNPTQGVLSCPPNRVPGADDIAWQPVLTFIGNESILPSESLPLDATQWNAFSSRAITLGFEVPGQAGVLIISAHIGQFHVVPEPSTLAYAACLTAVLLLVGPFTRISQCARRFVH